MTLRLWRQWRATLADVVERLEAAIGKLERLKAESTPGSWSSAEWRGYFLIEADGSRRAIVAERVITMQDVALIVILHRAVDAQLAILRFAADGLYDLPEFAALADAILDGDLSPSERVRVAAFGLDKPEEE